MSLYGATAGLQIAGSNIEARTVAAWGSTVLAIVAFFGTSKFKTVGALATLGFVGVANAVIYDLGSEARSAFVLISGITTIAATITAGVLESGRVNSWQAAGLGSLCGAAFAFIRGVPPAVGAGIGGALVTTAFTCLNDQPPVVSHRNSDEESLSDR